MADDDDDEKNDPWEAFGSESDSSSAEDDEKNGNDPKHHQHHPLELAAQAVATCLTQAFVKTNVQVSINQRRVGVSVVVNDSLSSSNVWKQAIAARGICAVDCDWKKEEDEALDAIVVVATTTAEAEAAFTKEGESRLCKALVPGGRLVLVCVSPSSTRECDMKTLQWNPSLWIPPSESSVQALDRENVIIRELVKQPCRVQTTTCPWLPSSHSLEQERDLLHQATVPLAHFEMAASQLTETSTQRATRALMEHGYCILPRLLDDPTTCQQWGQVVLQDLHEAADILWRNHGVDLYHPSSSSSSSTTTAASFTGTYRELSMREDFRVDVRAGPCLNRLRRANGGGDGNHSWMHTTEGLNSKSKTNNNNKQKDPSSFFRKHPDLLEIVCRVMNRRDEKLSPGNWGRYNFSGGGSDGSYQDLRVGPVGGIVTMPGCADQAVHADTPHLFEHLPLLPAHYINAFTPGCPSDDKVGQTAFIHGSHRLDVAARYNNNKSNSNVSTSTSVEMWKHLVRPRLELGDVLLFDCRILHFGMANTSDNNIERPLLYTNMTMHWFHDPKNWDDQRPIFEIDQLETD